MMNKKIFIVISVALLSAVIGCGVYFFIFNKKSADINFDYNDESAVFAVDIPADFDQFKLDRLEEKKQQALELYRKEKNDTWTWIVIGNYHEYAKNYERAVRDYERTLAIEPSEMISIVNIAHIYGNYLNDYIKAEEYYKRALRETSVTYQMYIDLALMYEYKLNKPTLAAATYLDGLKYNPDNPSLIIALIRLYKRQNDLTEAGKYASLLLRYFPENQQYKNEFGSLVK